MLDIGWTEVLLIAVVPLTDSVLKPVASPSKTALPLTARLLPAPATVLCAVTVLPVNVVFAPSVTAPV